VNRRAAKSAATRARILDTAHDLVREGKFYNASMEEIAERSGVTRVTLYRTFGTRQALIEGLFWEMLAAARLDLIDAAFAVTDVHASVKQVFRAYCEMFDELGESMPLALELARSDANMREIMGATYYGRRPENMARLAGRIMRAGLAQPSWTKKRIADALMVLSSYEAYDTLISYRGFAHDKAADLLYEMTGAFLIQE
jgi:AcrR family transcriptional regulator